MYACNWWLLFRWLPLSIALNCSVYDTRKSFTLQMQFECVRSVCGNWYWVKCARVSVYVRGSEREIGKKYGTRTQQGKRIADRCVGQWSKHTLKLNEKEKKPLQTHQTYTTYESDMTFICWKQFWLLHKLVNEIKKTKRQQQLIDNI